MNPIEAKAEPTAALAIEREEIINRAIKPYFDANRHRGSNLTRVHDSKYVHLIAHNSKDEGIYLVWGGAGQDTDLTEDVYEACVEEGEKAGLEPVYHIYSRFNVFATPGVRWYQIPDGPWMSSS